MKKQLIIAVATVYAALAGLVGAQAAVPSKQQPIEVTVQLGTQDSELVIIPSQLKFEKNQLYTLVLNNPSNITHYLSVPRFGAAVRTSKIDLHGGEVIRTGFQHSPRPILARSAATFSYKVKEIAVRPGGMVAWTFTPVRAGSYKFGCGIPAHAHEGMVGKILVK